MGQSIPAQMQGLDDVLDVEYSDLGELVFEMSQAGLKRFYPMVFIDFQRSLAKLAKHVDDNNFVSFATLENPRDRSSAFNPYEDALQILSQIDDAFQPQLKPDICYSNLHPESAQAKIKNLPKQPKKIEQIEDYFDFSSQESLTAQDETPQIELRSAQRSIPVYRFGCSETQNHSVLPIGGSGTVKSFAELYEKMKDKEVLSKIFLGGPISYYPIIQRAIEFAEQIKRDDQQAFFNGQNVQQLGELVVAFVLTNGGSSSTDVIDHEYIMRACSFPIAFVFITVGNTFDKSLDEFDNMHYRKFDNVNYIHLPDMYKKAMNDKRQMERNFKWEGKILFFEILRTIFEHKKYIISQCSLEEQKISVDFDNDQQEIVSSDEEDNLITLEQYSIQQEQVNLVKQEQCFIEASRKLQEYNGNLYQVKSINNVLIKGDSVSLFQILDIHETYLQSTIFDIQRQQYQQKQVEREKYNEKNKIQLKNKNILKFKEEESQQVQKENLSLFQYHQLNFDEKTTDTYFKELSKRFNQFYDTLYSSKEAKILMNQIMKIMQNSNVQKNISALERENCELQEQITIHSQNSLLHSAKLFNMLTQCISIAKQLDLLTKEYRSHVIFTERKSFIKLETIVEFLQKQFCQLLLNDIRITKLEFLERDDQVANIMRILEYFNSFIKEEISISYLENPNQSDIQVKERIPNCQEILKGKFLLRQLMKQPVVYRYLQYNETIKAIANATLIKTEEIASAIQQKDEKELNTKKTEFYPTIVHLLHNVLFANTTAQIFEESEYFYDEYVVSIEKYQFMVLNQLPIDKEIEDIQREELAFKTQLQKFDSQRSSVISDRGPIQEQSRLLISSESVTSLQRMENVSSQPYQEMEQNSVTFKRQHLRGKNQQGAAETEASITYLLYLYKSEGSSYKNDTQKLKDNYAKNIIAFFEVIKKRTEYEAKSREKEMKQWQKNYEGKSFTAQQQNDCVQQYLIIKESINVLQDQKDEIERLSALLTELLKRTFDEAERLRDEIVNEVGTKLALTSNQLRSVEVDQNLVEVVQLINAFELTQTESIKNIYDQECKTIKNDVKKIRNNRKLKKAKQNDISQSFVREIQLLNQYYKSRQKLNTATLVLKHFQMLQDNHHVASAEVSVDRIQSALVKMQTDYIYQSTYKNMLKEVMAEIPDSFRWLVKNGTIKVFNNRYLDRNGKKIDQVVELNTFEHHQKFVKGEK